MKNHQQRTKYIKTKTHSDIFTNNKHALIDAPESSIRTKIPNNRNNILKFLSYFLNYKTQWQYNQY